jgi:methylglutaconyl-CoA hydratase
MIKTVLSNGPEAMRQAKALIFDVAYQTIDSNLLTETSKRIANIRVSDEGQEGLNSFFEKRPPQWTLNKDSAFTTSKNNKG